MSTFLRGRLRCTRGRYQAALEEHRAVNALVLPDLKGTDPTSEAFTGRAKVLRDIIEHHMVEEESHLFALAQDTMDSALLEQLASRAVEFKTAARAGDRAH